MADGKPWHIVDDCLEPLASEMIALANRFQVSFDVQERLRLEAEYEKVAKEAALAADTAAANPARRARKKSKKASVVKAANCGNDQLDEDPRARLAEISRQLSAQKVPPHARDLEFLYEKFRINQATEWLKVHVSVGYGEDFWNKLENTRARFAKLEFKACQILNGDYGNSSTVWIRHAIPRLIDRHFKLLHEESPNHEDRPELEEMPDDLRAFEGEILDEYNTVETQIRDTGNHLRIVAALVRQKLARAGRGKSEPPEAASDTPTPTRPKRSTERGEGRAKLIAALTKHHKYADGGCLNLEPISNNELARLAGVSGSTASAFFKSQFNRHAKYRAICANSGRLVAALKLLNQEFAPHILYGSKPPGEDERDDDE